MPVLVSYRRTIVLHTDNHWHNNKSPLLVVCHSPIVPYICYHRDDKVFDDKKQGQGTFTWVNGDKYVGQWMNDRMHGQGIYYHADGNKYEGQWVNDMKQGQGTFTWNNGDKYTGQWMNDRRHGQGTYTWADGTRNSGIWKEGKFIG